VQGLVDSRAVSAERADVVVAGAGLVGLSLAYELACLGARVTLVDAGHPGRATDAGAGILSPATSLEGDADLWPFLREAGAHYPRLLERLVADGAGVSDTRYGVCGVLSLCLRSSEDTWFSPFAEAALRRAPGEVSEIGAAAAAALFPPLGPVHRVLHAPGSARVDGRGMAAALREATTVRGVDVVDGVVHGVVAAASGGSGRRVESVCIEGRRNVDCDALAVAGGAWSAAMGEWLGCPLPVGPTKGQIVHLGVEADTAQWPIVQPLLTHYLVPWPGGRVACGGTFEAAAGFSVTATAGGLHELLRECLSVAPGLEGARYLETRVGLRPTSADDRALVGRVPGWANAWVATGHGANGLLQGPYSARLLAHAVIGEGVTAGEVPLPDAFDPARFG
jgi:D-amino-acid dehydrogenase